LKYALAYADFEMLKKLVKQNNINNSICINQTEGLKDNEFNSLEYALFSLDEIDINMIDFLLEHGAQLSLNSLYKFLDENKVMYLLTNGLTYEKLIKNSNNLPESVKLVIKYFFSNAESKLKGENQQIISAPPITDYSRLLKKREKLEILSKKLKLNKDLTNAEEYYSQGNILVEIGDMVLGNGYNYKEALKNYNKAIELKPDYTDVFIKRLPLYVKLGKIPEAKIDLEKLKELQPTVENESLKPIIASTIAEFEGKL
jgi:tetratricopeptide (TPR) repeat protein